MARSASSAGPDNTRKNLKLALLSLLGLALGLETSCQHTARRPAQLALPDPEIDRVLRFERSIDRSVKTVHDYIRSDSFGPSQCMEFMTRLQRRLAPARIADFDLEELKTNAPHVLEGLWQLRRTLHSKLASLPDSCVRESRSTFRSIRFLEDYVAEWFYKPQTLQPGSIDFFQQPVPIRERPNHYLLFTSDRGSPEGSFEFRDGDIIVTRGVSFLSANIARIGTSETQFSHIVFFHREPDGTGHTIESYVGSGVGTYDLDYALRNENARILVLRSRDAELASRASTLMWNRVTQATRAGSPIPYDFDFDWDNHDRMSCAEVARAAYKTASSGQFVVPSHPSIIDFRNTDFLSRIGMKNGMTFSPGDMEIDPRFELVAEWRDLRITRDSRQKDAILSSMFRWMDEEGYMLRDSGQSRLATRVIWPGSQTIFWPLLRRITGAPESTPQVPQRIFGTMALLNQIGAGFLGKVAALDAEHERATGWPMTMTELYEAIEKLRVEDLERWKRGGRDRRNTVFHRYFRPAIR